MAKQPNKKRSQSGGGGTQETHRYRDMWAHMHRNAIKAPDQKP